MPRLNPIAEMSKLMRRLSVGHKLALMGGLFIAPLALVLASLLAREFSDLAAVRAEVDGARLIAPTLSVLRQVQTQRIDAALARQRGQATPATANALEPLLAKVDTVLERDSLATLRSAWQSVRQAMPAAGADGPAHAAAVAALRGWLLLVGEHTSLLFDPQPTTDLYIALALNRTLPWSEALSNLAAASLPAFGGADARALGMAEAWLSQVPAAQGPAQDAVAALVRGGESAPKQWASALEASAAFVALSRQAMDATPGIDPAAYATRAHSALAAVDGFGAGVVERLNVLLLAREQALETERLLALTSVVLGLLALMALALLFHRGFTGALRIVMAGVSASTAGNLAHRIALQGNDELARIGGQIETMNATLSTMVADIRTNAAIVEQSGRALALGNKALAQRTEQQAANLEQTTANLHEVARTVSDNAESAQRANALARQVSAQTAHGSAAMREAVATMHGIESSSRKVGEIIATIDSIAFQTNILALNAAVEAARAGDQGRGFAVVATEVRSLAHRSAAAAREVKTLVGESSARAGEGVQRIAQVAGSLDQVVLGIREVAGSVEGIAQASMAQRDGLAQIAEAVSELESITQRNAQLVEQSSASARQLGERAEGLAQAVSTFRLRQGTADEAMALMAKARALADSTSPEAAERSFCDPAGTFHDRDMYVFVLDRQGTYRAFGGRPERVGSSVMGVAGLNGRKLLDDAFEACRNGGGWIDYDIVNVATGRVEPKMSYVLPLDASRVMGCGVYKTAANDALRGARHG